MVGAVTLGDGTQRIHKRWKVYWLWNYATTSNRLSLSEILFVLAKYLHLSYLVTLESRLCWVRQWLKGKCLRRGYGHVVIVPRG